MKQSLQLKLGQQLSMTPQLQQAIRLLQLSTIELQTEVHQLLEENPMLEIDEDNLQSIENTEQNKTSLDETSEGEASDEQVTQLDLENAQQMPEELAVDANWEDSYDMSSSANNHSNNQQSTSNLSTNDFLENQSTDADGLSEHLTWQRRNACFSDTDKIIAITIIDAINEDGYLSESLEEIYNGLKNELDIELDEVEAVLHRVQHFDPIGVGARDLKECLLLQIDAQPPTDEYDAVKTIIENHLQLLASHDYARLQKILHCNQKTLATLVAFIQTLNPKPGALISNTQARYITPDIYVQKINNKWCVSLNQEAIPKIKINSVYENHLKNATVKGDNNQLKTSLQEARWFVNCLQTRNQTLLRVGQAIVKRQQRFLNYGEEGMKPMVLRDIADELEMHESTISRTSTHKYMHTPRGIFELKYFFSSHVGTVDGGECSATAIRYMVKKLINNENPQKPMSDNKITNLLVKDGINVARRTVAKYRESMLIPPSNERKRLA